MVVGSGAVGKWAVGALPSADSSAVNYTLTCAVGAYVYTGQAATLAVTRNYVLTCDAGAYSYTGQAATLNYVDGSAPTASSGGWEWLFNAGVRKRHKLPEEEEVRAVIADKPVIKLIEKIAANDDVIETKLLELALELEQKNKIYKSIYGEVLRLKVREQEFIGEVIKLNRRKKIIELLLLAA